MEAVRFSTLDDADYLAPRLRDEDLQELIAAGSPDALTTLKAGVLFSKPALSVVDADDRAVTMFGVCPSSDPFIGYIWLLSSDVLDRNKMKFLRHCKQWLEALHKHYPVLTNRVDARNTVHIKWLEWMGFTFVNRVPGQGPGNLPFYEFLRLQDV